MELTWQQADGDNTYALDWNLNEDSHVWEIGGFEGRWAQQIWDKFHCNITIFEPQLWAVERMQKRFEGIEKIDIRPYGLWTEDVLLPIGNYHTDGASLVNDDGREEKQFGAFKNFYYEIQNFPHDINLVLMNIEGGEWHLLPNMIVSGIIVRFENFWCQFHPGLNPDSSEIYKYICKEMGNRQRLRELDLLWDFYPTAVAWRKR